MSSRDPRTGRQSMVSPRGQPGQSEGFRLSPLVVFITIALVLSVAYAVYALTVRDTSQIPLLASGAVVVGIAFGALALYSLSAVWRAGTDGRGGRAILLGIVGGIAAMVAAGCLAVAVILFMLAGSS
jgi:heme/copper-type cytochrome/quinol oxidase subunit 3